MEEMVIPEISRARFTYENFGSKMGISWPTCYHINEKVYSVLKEWRLVGLCKNPEIPSICGGKRPFAIMYECIKTYEDYGLEIEAGTLAWFHYGEIPKFVKEIE